MQSDISLPGGIKLCPEHAIYIRDDDALAICDLHLGYEASLQAEHIAIPRFQLAPMLQRLEGLLKRFNPELVVINGDMKHSFSKNKGQEWDEVEAVLDVLAGTEVIIVRGNHDNYLKSILYSRGIDMKESHILHGSGISFLHGHKNIEHEGFRIMGHEHPMLRFRDDVGAMVNLPCFLYDEMNRLAVMPAFSPLASGTNVISPEENFMSPELRTLDLSGARVYAIKDGIYDFGRVSGLRKLRNESMVKSITK